MNKKILVFGFKPYGIFKTNISEVIVNKLDNKKISKKIILPVIFNSNRIIKKIKEIKPDTVIGLFQHPRARKIRIERKAKNMIRLKKEKKSRLINKNSKKVLFTNLKINKINETTIAYNAGTYVCNYTMFNIMDYITKNKKDTKFAFLHIPKDYNIKKGVKAVNEVINNINLNKI